MSYEILEKTFYRLAQIDHALAMLGWDQQVVMPPKGNEARARSMAELKEENGLDSDYDALLGEVVPLQHHVASGAWMWQAVDVPSGSGPITLSFWYRIFTRDRDETACFRVVLQDSSGGFLEEVLRDGYIAIIPPSQLVDLGWRQGTFDLSAYRGQTIRLWFRNWIIVDGAQGTWTYVDDVRID